jgi:arylsulfatase A-like enzyme
MSYNIVENPVHVHDLHATILHQLGIDHEKLAFKYQGLAQRLTGVEPATVMTGVLA